MKDNLKTKGNSALLKKKKGRVPNLAEDSLRDIIKFRTYSKKTKAEPVSNRESIIEPIEPVEVKPTIVVENGIIKVQKIDYESLKNEILVKTQQGADKKVELVDDNSTKLNYLSFIRKKIPHEKWTEEENQMFYRSLEYFGTDFSMIALLLKTKTRKQLKSKFTKEEKQNKTKIAKCLKNNREKGRQLITLFRKFQMRELCRGIPQSKVEFKPLLLNQVDFKELDKFELEDLSDSSEGSISNIN